MNSQARELRFYGGVAMSFLPLLVFLILALAMALKGEAEIRGMLAGALLGLMAPLFLARNREAYAQSIIDGMSHPLAVIPVACWLFSGVFAAVLRWGGLVEGVVWLAYHLGAQGHCFPLISFFASALFATASGTGLATIVAGMAVLYPAGILLGAPAPHLAGAIIGGGALGDTLAPISDTTICSAISQGADIPGVVKSRLPYVLIALALTVLSMLVSMRSGSVSSEIPLQRVLELMDPRGLSMLIPAFLTLYCALKGWHIIASTTLGTCTGIIMALTIGLGDWKTLFWMGGSETGPLLGGIEMMVELSLLAILIMACVHIFRRGGGADALLHLIARRIKTPGEAEGAIVLITLFLTTIMVLNAPPILAAGIALARPLGKIYGIHPYRRANLLDASACTLVYSLPWAPSLLLAREISIGVSQEYGALFPVLKLYEVIPRIYFCHILLFILFIAVCTGWGRQFQNGSAEKEGEQDSIW